MISELDKIQRGLVEATVEYNTQRKVIGVSTTNLLPNEKGIVPLSKQGAFQVVEQVETVDFLGAVDGTQNNNQEEVMEKLDLPLIGDTPEQTLQEPVHSDVITSSPVSVESPEDLSGFKIPEPVVEEAPSMMEPIGPVAVDIQMPQMPETIVANEPETLNENIFETTMPVTEEIESPVVNPELAVMPELEPVTAEVQEQAPANSEEILSAIPSTTPTNEQPPMFEPTVDTNETIMPDINIEMPILQNEITPAAEELPAIEPIEQTLPISEPTPVIPPVETAAPIENVLPAVEQAIEEPVAETLPTNEQELLPEVEVKEEQPSLNNNASKIVPSKDFISVIQPIIDKYNKGIEEVTKNFLEQLQKINEERKQELIEATSSLANDDVKSVESVAKTETIQTPTPIMPLENTNMINSGNNLVDDAINMINAMSDAGPTL